MSCSRTRAQGDCLSDRIPKTLIFEGPAGTSSPTFRSIIDVLIVAVIVAPLTVDVLRLGRNMVPLRVAFPGTYPYVRIVIGPGEGAHGILGRG